MSFDDRKTNNIFFTIVVPFFGNGALSLEIINRKLGRVRVHGRKERGNRRLNNIISKYSTFSVTQS